MAEKNPPTPKRNALTPAEIQQRLQAVPRWTLTDGHLARTFQFASFPAAFGFMTSVAIIAQEMNHHPDWSNSYTTVTIRLMSHDVEGLSERDFRLAAKIDDLLERPAM